MKTWLRRLALASGALVLLLALVIGGAYAMSSSAVGGGHAVEAHPFDASMGNAEEGARLAELYGCVECHGADLGGTMLIDGMPFARVPAPNLTAGREHGALTDQHLETAVRHGVGADGRALFVMPSAEYTYLDDAELADIVAYLRTRPAVSNELPPRAFGPVGRVMVALDRIPFQPDLLAADAGARHMSRPAAGETLALGHYLTRLCTGCHGRDLTGGAPLAPDTPPPPDLTPGGNLGGWTMDQFAVAMRTGKTPDGRDLDPTIMPWRAIGAATDAEMAAVWEYLRNLPASGS
jgi:mono/diheme cytochrome c family protein